MHNFWQSDFLNAFWMQNSMISVYPFLSVAFKPAPLNGHFKRKFRYDLFWNSVTFISCKKEHKSFLWISSISWIHIHENHSKDHNKQHKLRTLCTHRRLTKAGDVIETEQWQRHSNITVQIMGLTHGCISCSHSKRLSATWPSGMWGRAVW